MKVIGIVSVMICPHCMFYTYLGHRTPFAWSVMSSVETMLVARQLLKLSLQPHGKTRTWVMHKKELFQVQPMF